MHTSRLWVRVDLSVHVNSNAQTTTSSGTGEKETLNIKVVGKNMKLVKLCGPQHVFMFDVFVLCLFHIYSFICCFTTLLNFPFSYFSYFILRFIIFSIFHTTFMLRVSFSPVPEHVGS